jgi:GNAT superfamily N-acetyltransferase
MISVATNPQGIDEAYLRGLEVCFPGAWDEAIFRWHFRRPFGGRDPDTLAILKGGAPVSGFGLNYRQLAKSDGEVIDVAIVTAAWTLPRDRGRGYLLRLLRTAVARARERECSALLSFMTADNASAVLLRRAGAWSVPTFYLAGTARAAGEPSFDDSPSPNVTPRAASAPAVGFHYALHEDWRSQFIDRPLPTECIGSGDATAVVERTPDADRLLMLLAPPNGAAAMLERCARHARNAGRGFFHVTTSPGLARAARSRGLAVRAGYLMVQDIAAQADLNVPRHTVWCVHSGDRM